MNARKLIIPIILLVLWLPVKGQVAQTLTPATITVKGTSTMHDWEMTSAMVKGQANFVMEDKLVAVKNLTISIPAENLKSGKDGMDKNAYKALKTGQHKNITFELTKVLDIVGTTNRYEVRAEGKLQIAGVTKVVPLQAVCTREANSGFRCQGEKTFKMSEFNVEPPSFMFGTVKTGDDITIAFDVSFPGSSTISNVSNSTK